MTTKKIEIIIDTDGTVAAEAFGFKGCGCTEELDVFARALGETTSVKNKGEYYAKETERVKVGWKK